MTALTRSLGQLSAVLGVVGTAISTAAALRITPSAGTPARRVRD